MNNKFVLKKRGKYLKGWSYATSFGTSFVWTYYINEAHIFYSSDCGEFTYETKGKGVPIVVKEKLLKSGYRCSDCGKYMSKEDFYTDKFGCKYCRD